MTWYRYGGQILKVGGKIAIAASCCCVDAGCCESMPSTIYCHVSLCGDYVATLTEYFPTNTDYRAWEGCVEVAEGTLCIRFACADGNFKYCTDGCGAFSCDRDDPSGFQWAIPVSLTSDCTSPYATQSQAPPSLCDSECGDLMTLTWTDAA